MICPELNLVIVKASTQCDILEIPRVYHVCNQVNGKVHSGFPANWEPTLALARDERYQLVLRINASRAFSKAARLRDLLHFVAVHTLDGGHEDIAELTIGRRLFSRGEDYIPSEDSIVRGAVRQLRLKLKEYFETEGIDEPWRIEIPRGGFAPLFTRAEEAAPVVQHVIPAAVPADVPASPLRRSWWLILFATANLLFLAGNVWMARRQVVPDAPRVSSVVSTVFSTARGTVNVVVSDFSVVLLKNLFSRPDYSLNDYSAWNYSQIAPSKGTVPEIARIAETLRTHRITRFGDLIIAAGILRAAGPATHVVIRHARDLSAREFLEGDAILLGNANSTPWVGLFEERLNFPHVRKDAVGFANRSPRAGEPTEFTVRDAGQEHGLGYGRLALVPNLSGKGSVLLISGLNMVTMESAGDFALNPIHTPELLNALGAPSLDKIPYFELVLETQAVDNAPSKARILAARRLGPRTR